MKSALSHLDSRKMAIGQGVIYVASGIWPIVDIRSFEKVTGPKADHWLVKTVGGLITVTGAVLLGAGIRRRPISMMAALIGAGQAAVLGASSLIYSSRGRISKVYLWDVALESAIVGGWMLALRGQTSRTKRYAPGPVIGFSGAPRSTRMSAPSDSSDQVAGL